MDDAQLRTLWQQKQRPDRISQLGHPITMLMKHTLAKRVKQLGALAEIWDDIIPDAIRDHTALESYNRGILTVMVDSAPHRFQLQNLLTGGFMKEIRNRFSGPLNKIRLIPGQFYSIDMETGQKRYGFE